MSMVTTLARPNRAAAEAIAIPPTTPLAAIQLHAQAENALSMSLYYLRQPSTNVRGAMRKAVQSLAALSLMQAQQRTREAANDTSGG